jgi:hypothetical protein
MTVRLSALRTGRPLPPGRFLILIYVWGDNFTFYLTKKMTPCGALNNMVARPSTRQNNLHAYEIWSLKRMIIMTIRMVQFWLEIETWNFRTCSTNAKWTLIRCDVFAVGDINVSHSVAWFRSNFYSKRILKTEPWDCKQVKGFQARLPATGTSRNWHSGPRYEEDSRYRKTYSKHM